MNDKPMVGRCATQTVKGPWAWCSMAGKIGNQKVIEKRRWH